MTNEEIARFREVSACTERVLGSNVRCARHAKTGQYALFRKEDTTGTGIGSAVFSDADGLIEFLKTLEQRTE